MTYLVADLCPSLNITYYIEESFNKKCPKIKGNTAKLTFLINMAVPAIF